MRRAAGRERPPAFLRGLSTRLSAPVATIGAAMLSGWLAGASPPGGPVPWLGVVAYLPLFLAMHAIGRQPQRPLRGWWRIWLVCWGAGLVFAATVGGWLVEGTIRFADMSPLAAVLFNWLGFGSVLGGQLWLAIGLPFHAARTRPVLRFWLVLATATAVQTYLPGYIPWTFGQALHPWPWPVQVADLVGSTGLNALVLAPQLLLAEGLLRIRAQAAMARRPLATLAGGLVVAHLLAAGYGWVRIQQVTAATAQGRPLTLVAVQPNFPAEGRPVEAGRGGTPGQDTRLGDLLSATAEGLAARRGLGSAPGLPTLVVWPESAYPLPYLDTPRASAGLGRWIARREVHLLLGSIGPATGVEPDGRPGGFHGLALLVPPDGGPPAVHRKMALMPFGDTIPLAWVPGLEGLLRRQWPRAGRYLAGQTPAVFPLAAGVALAPMVCFDVLDTVIAATQARNGAGMGVVLANLAWFGSSNVADLFTHFARFRALESRMPVLISALTGPTVLLDATGTIAPQALPRGQAGALTLQVRLPAVPSFYARYQPALHGAYALAAVGLWLGLAATCYRRRGATT